MLVYVRPSNRHTTQSPTYYDKNTTAFDPNTVDFPTLPVGLVYVENSVLFLTIIGLMDLLRKDMQIFRIN